MKLKKKILLVSIFMLVSHDHYGVDSLKGFFSSLSNFPLFKAATWQNMLYGFGAPPEGYIYSYEVYNDTQQSIWVAQQSLVSVMGGCFPAAGGWHLYPSSQGIAPGDHFTQLRQSYYFEMFIKSTPDSYANHMPYLQHSDVLYQKDCINLEEKNSTKKHCFRAYVGKKLQQGKYVYVPKAEYVGYIQMSNTKDTNAIVRSSDLASLTIKNSTQTDYIIGFTQQVGLTAATMKQELCLVYTKLGADSFGLLSTFGNVKSLRPGTIGVFDVTTQQCVAVTSLAEQGFEGMTYTLEIHEDGTSIVATWQGISEGNYDQPLGKIRDLTPIAGYFWYQSAVQAGSGFDIPGTVWVVDVGSENKILAMAQVGQAIEFQINRPQPGQRQQLYFLYVASTVITQVQAFVEKFISGQIGAEVLSSYHDASSSMIEQAQQVLKIQKATASKAAKPNTSADLLQQAVQGTLSIKEGKIVDPQTGVVGYLLGSDVFLSVGIGATPMYYLLAPSIQNQSKLPTSAVLNLYAQEFMTKKPKGMPNPIMSTFAPMLQPALKA